MAGITHNLRPDPTNAGKVTWSLKKPAGGSFDTTFTFNPNLTDDGEGVTATVASPADGDERFSFNKRANPAGTPVTMTLNLASSDVCQVDFPSDYTGDTCRYRSKTGVNYNTTFQSGTVVL